MAALPICHLYPLICTGSIRTAVPRTHGYLPTHSHNHASRGRKLNEENSSGG